MKPANITRLALAVASASVVSGSAVAQAQDEPYLLEQLVVTAAGYRRRSAYGAGQCQRGHGTGS